ncbi:HEAT repeat domain-containing protein [Paracoccus lutimaris]|uniref:Alpha/beta hydrolase n=1 Tax=Paracoccus lutimaris TaxID=1490030 RepID=A0A368YQD2_9RHOB|nr:HEAT repeat domain-containing protein [Paracoccus lutimaris]RCW82430.1 hypothetical protein DFP89_11227 [Paracoccus lutimaris]
MTAQTLHQDDRYRVTLFRGSGGGARLAVSFDHGRPQMRGGFTKPKYPHFAEQLGIDALTVQTAWRDWFISERSATLAEVLADATRDRAEVICTGFSMGGYGALLYSAACHAKRVLAVSPQYSIDPAVAPFDAKRHQKFARIGRPMPCPQEWGDPQVGGLLLYDPAIAADRAHMQLITRAFPRLMTIALPHGGHPATGVIAAYGGIGRVARMVATDQIDASAIRQLHRRYRRRVANYRLSLASAALPRHPQRAVPELLRLAHETDPEIRFQAGLTLLEHGHSEATPLLIALLDEFPDAPRSWARRMNLALRKAEAATKAAAGREGRPPRPQAPAQTP